MDAKELMASILQSAISGKLVPQLESEPEVLTLGELLQDEPFSIPPKWKWKKLSDIGSFNPNISLSDEKEATFLPMSAISAGYENKVDLSQKRLWKNIKSGYSKFANGDIILAKITPCFQNLKSAICQNLTNGVGAGSTEFHVIRPNSLVNNEYLLIFLKSPYFIKYGVKNFTGTAGQQRIGTVNLKKCLIPIPSIAEQERIVDRVRELSTLVQSFQIEDEKLRIIRASFPCKLKETILQQAMQGKLVPQLESEPSVDRSFREPQKIPFKIPCKWAWVKFSDVATLLNGRAYSKSELLENAPGRTPVLRVGNLFTKSSWYYSDLELSSDKYCDNGDLLFAWSASFGPKIWDGGKCIYHYHIWKVICSELVDREWLYFWLLAMTNELKNRSGRGSTMIHITKKDTEQVPLALPPIEEQRRIVQTIKSLFMFIEAL